MQSHKKLKTYNSYVKPAFFSKKLAKSSLPQAEKIQKVNDIFIAQSDKFNISVPLTSTGNIILKKSTAKAFKKTSKSKKNTHSLVISLPNKENSTFTGHAKVAQDNTVVYENYQENTDVAVQTFKDSIRILTILNDADAPNEYKYKINVPSGGKIEKLKNGSILIFDSNQKLFAGFAPAWAVDKNGQKIPTHYKIEGEELIQVIEHLSVNTVYPVVADPLYGYDLIDYAYWKPRGGGHTGLHDWILAVKPTYWARTAGAGSYTVGLSGWYELYNKFKNNWLRYNLFSMKNQYICHQQYAFYKSFWNLDEWRPAVSYMKTVTALCNP